MGEQLADPTGNHHVQATTTTLFSCVTVHRAKLATKQQKRFLWLRAFENMAAQCDDTL
jgi:hypothetical protein